MRAINLARFSYAKNLRFSWCFDQRGLQLSIETIDSKSVSLADILEIKPWLIKPNREEISQYLGREIFSFDEDIPAVLSEIKLERI